MSFGRKDTKGCGSSLPSSPALSTARACICAPDPSIPPASQTSLRWDVTLEPHSHLSTRPVDDCTSQSWELGCCKATHQRAHCYFPLPFYAPWTIVAATNWSLLPSYSPFFTELLERSYNTVNQILPLLCLEAFCGFSLHLREDPKQAHLVWPQPTSPAWSCVCFPLEFYAASTLVLCQYLE